MQDWYRAQEAADYAIASWEWLLYKRFGRRQVRLVGKLAGAAIIGLPVAWIICGFQMNRDGVVGIAAGVALFAVIDACRQRRSSHVTR